MTTKEQIAKEYERLTFMPMKGVEERDIEELRNVLNSVIKLKEAE